MKKLIVYQWYFKKMCQKNKMWNVSPHQTHKPWLANGEIVICQNIKFDQPLICQSFQKLPKNYCKIGASTHSITLLNHW